MKTLSIHNLDAETAALLRKKAKTSGASLNKTIQFLLRKALGLGNKNIQENGEQFLSLFSVWTSKDAVEFDKAAGAFETIDKEDWR